MISLITLAIVFTLIAVRKIGNIRLQIWQIMLLGALVVLVTGQISPLNTLKAINADVMIFLFCVFTIGQAMEDSGYLGHLAGRLFGKAHTLNSLVLLILFGMGLLSALLLNDTLAIIGTPVVLSLASRTHTQPKILLLALAFAVTIGSVMSPIGNPQNLLIAIHGNVTNPFVTFLRYLLVPTLLNLAIAYGLLRLFYREHFHVRPSVPSVPSVEPIKDARLANLARISLAILGVLALIKILLVFIAPAIDFKLTYIALAAALPIFIFIPRRPGILKRLDWFTLIFFAAMFVLTQSVWDSGYFQRAIASTNINLNSTGMILGVSVLLSQLLSNVPLVVLYLPVLLQAGAMTPQMMALAAGSTIAGNLTILGAASNIIVIQNAEKRGGATLTFLEFVKIGVPLTILNVAVYWLFLLIFL
jgi:Na+/H+ antiporter NhaD/arsenite permease-like protein